MVTGTGSVAQGSPVSTTSIKNEMSVASTIPPRRTSDNRRSNKPIMEKRRRARINNCLNELKALILDAMKKDPARHSKLEKADILEMTVKHLENLQRQQVAMSAATDPAVLNKFRAGFSECAGEVGRFPGLDPTVKRRLLQHLANCLAGSTQLKQQEQVTNSHQSVQVHILPSPTSTTSATIETHVPTLTAQNGIIFSNVNGTGVQLVPTRLPNGDIALVLPTTGQQTQTLFRQHISSPSSSPCPSSVSSTSSSGESSPLPMLVPIPTRTASTASAASSTSSLTYEQISNSNVGRDSMPSSPEPMDTTPHHQSPYSPPAQKPLSLVMRKSYEPVEEEKPWRPW